MSDFLEILASRRRFGMRPGLDVMRALCAAIGNPHEKFKAIHVAGTNGKGAVCAFLSAALSSLDNTARVCRYTSPHLVKINERFVIDALPASDEALAKCANIVQGAIKSSVGKAGSGAELEETTFFEALTAMAYLLFADIEPDYAILECGLGGRLDATNICSSELSIITKIGLDHCDWLGGSIESIAAEKAGIIKSGVPVVLAKNDEAVKSVVAARARALGSPFYYAPDIANESELPSCLPLGGAFNRENAVTALAALRVLSKLGRVGQVNLHSCFANARWPGRFDRVGCFLMDGAHNPPAAEALSAALREKFPGLKLPLVAGFCADKDAQAVLTTLAPLVSKGFAVKTNNQRSLSAQDVASVMEISGIPSEPCASLAEAMEKLREGVSDSVPTLVTGSLFLVGEALNLLLATSLGGTSSVIDPSELLRGT